MYCSVGQYYCAACNVSLNSESQFGQHQVRAEGENWCYNILCFRPARNTSRRKFLKNQEEDEFIVSFLSSCYFESNKKILVTLL